MKLEANLIIKRSGSSLRLGSNFIFADEDVDIEEEIDLYDPVSARDEELSGNALLWSSYIVQEVDMKESSM